jgi:hypothetical protein
MHPENESVTGFLFYVEIFNFDGYFWQMLQPFFRQLTDKEILHGHFQQDSVAA